MRCRSEASVVCCRLCGFTRVCALWPQTYAHCSHVLVSVYYIELCIGFASTAVYYSASMCSLDGGGCIGRGPATAKPSLPVLDGISPSWQRLLSHSEARARNRMATLWCELLLWSWLLHVACAVKWLQYEARGLHLATGEIDTARPWPRIYACCYRALTCMKSALLFPVLLHFVRNNNCAHQSVSSW